MTPSLRISRWASPSSPWLVVADDGRAGAQWGHTGQMWRHQASRTLIWFASERLRSEKASPLDRAIVDQ
jgi:hypothetical protein